MLRIHRRLLFVALALLVAGLLGPPSRAAPSAPVPPPSGRLDRLAVDFTGRLGPALEGWRIPTMTLLAQVRLPPGIFSAGLARLAGLTRQLVLTRLRALGFRKVAVASPLATGAAVRARARKRGHTLTLLVTFLEAGGRLHLRGELWDTRATLWGRLKGRADRLLTHLHTAVALNPELRSYLQRPSNPKALSCRGTWAPLGKADYWGAALGDVDGDGRTELVLLSRTGLWIRRWSTVYSRFDTVAKVPLPGPVAAVRPRFPLASLALADLDGDRRLDILVRTSERAAGQVISYQKGRFMVRRRVDGYPVGALRLAGRTRLATLFPRTGRAEWNGRSLGFQPAFRVRFHLPAVVLGLRFGARRGPRGKTRPLVAVVDRAGHLRVLRVRDGRVLQRVPRVGVAFALRDLTGDGRPELVTTTAKSFGAGDALVVRRLGKRAPVCRVSGFEGSVTAVAAGDVYLDGRPRIVAVVWQENKQQSYLLVVR